MNALSNFSIKTKLSLMLLLPLLGLLYFSGAAVVDKFRTVDNLHALQSLVRLAVKNSAAIHEIQKERGLSAGFLGSRGEKFAAELGEQRAATDRKLGELKTFLNGFDAAPFGAGFKNSLGGALSRLDKLSEMRQSVSALQAAPKDSFTYYTGTIDALLDVAGNITKVSRDAEIVRATSSYFLFLNGKERLGRERATLNGVFAADRFEPESLQRFIALMAAEDTYFTLFATYAGSGALAFFREKSGGDYSTEVDALRKTALAKMTEGGFGVEPARWFKAITGKINAMKEVEDRLSLDLDALAAHEVFQARRAMWLSAAFTAAAVLLTLFISYLVATGILRPVRNLHGVMMRLKETDDLTLRCQVEGNDEVGQMAGAFNGMIASFQEIIGKLDLHAQQVSSSAHQLAAATEQLTQGSNAQTEAAAACAATVEQMTASSASVADSANEVAALSKDTLSRAQNGNQSLSELFGAIDVAEGTVSGIAGSVKQFIDDAVSISRLTQEVRDIAEQTNLLALNAAIEAARAGDQGRGFAVVADEVRKLAEKSAASANEIDVVTRAVGQHSETVDHAVKEGVKSLNVSQEAMENVAMVMADAAHAVGDTTGGIDNITAAVKEQNTAINDIARSVEQIAHMAEENGFAVSSVSSTAISLQDVALELQQTVGKFRY